MTEFARLLRDAAGQPPRPLNMNAVRQRASAMSLRRRIGFGIVGLGALVGIGASTGLSPLPAGDRPAQVDTIGIDQDRRVPTPSTGLVTPDPSPKTSPSSTVEGPQPARLAVPTAESASAPRDTPTADERTDLFSSHPPARECSVDTNGLAVGEQRSCGFTATEAGGWNYYEPPHVTSGADADVEVLVIRRGEEPRSYRLEKIYSGGPTGGYNLRGCADGIIEPGDRVQVTITARDSEWAGRRWELGAGAGWGCSDPGP